MIHNRVPEIITLSMLLVLVSNGVPAAQNIPNVKKHLGQQAIGMATSSNKLQPIEIKNKFLYMQQKVQSISQNNSVTTNKFTTKSIMRTKN